MSGIQHASNQSIRPFKTSEEYLYAMKEDLAEWLNDLYGININVDNIMDILETGALLCAHANNVTRVAEDFSKKHTETQVQVPASGVTFVSTAQPATFLARDNVSNFINWCRHQMNIKDVLMFETDDLVLRKNEKNFVLCLLEVARRASRFGMAAPVLIQLEQEIEDEIRVEMDAREPTQPAPQRRLLNAQNLDEMVQYLLSHCTCPTQFPLVKISDGKYRVGDSNTLIFVRILRNHVMVRVGGGWDTLEHYLDKHDPCRCTSLTHKLAQRPATPVHEIKARPRGPDSQTPLVLSRAQSPLEPVIWASSAPYRTQSVIPPPRASRSPDPGPRNTHSPNKLRERLTCSKSQDDSALKSTSRTGREATRGSPTPRLASSLPRPARPSTPPQPEHAGVALAVQRAHCQASPQGQQCTDHRLGQTWTKSQFVSKLRQNATAGAKNIQETQGAPEKQAGSRPFQCITPVQSLNTNRNSSENHQPPTIRIQASENSGNAKKNPDFIRTFCPFNGLMSVISGEAHAKCPAATGRDQPAGSTHHSRQITLAVDGNERNLQRAFSHSNRKKYLCLPVNTVPDSPIQAGKSNSPVTAFQPFEAVIDVDIKGGRGEMESSFYLFTPPPISPAQEAILYQSLEEEILTNLQQLGMDSDDSDSGNRQHSSRPESNEIQKPDCVSSATSPSESFTPDKAKKSKSQAVADKCSNGRLQREMFAESWVNTLSRGLRARNQESHFSADSSHWSVSKTSKVSSCSHTQGSSTGSNDSTEPSKVTEASSMVGVGSTQGNSLRSGTDKPEKAQAFTYSQKRSLKKPERVPSVYKLKLRHCIRPRRDHRSDKKPSRIPKPVFCERGQCTGDVIQTKNTGDSAAMSDIQNTPNIHPITFTRSSHQTAPKFTPTTMHITECQAAAQEQVIDQERESWV